MYLKFNDLVIDSEKSSASISGESINLSHKEFELLRLFIENQSQIISKQTILEHVWKTQHRSDASVKKLVSDLRKKLKDNTESPSFIKTQGREGYQWIAKEANRKIKLSNTHKAGLTCLLVLFSIFSIYLSYSLYNPETNASHSISDAISLELPNSSQSMVQLSPDGRYASYFSIDGFKNGLEVGKFVLYDVSLAREVAYFPSTSSDIKFSPDSKHLLSAQFSKCKLAVFDIEQNITKHIDLSCSSFAPHEQAYTAWGWKPNTVYMTAFDEVEKYNIILEISLETGFTQTVYKPSNQNLQLAVLTRSPVEENVLYFIEEPSSQNSGMVKRLNLNTGEVSTILSHPSWLFDFAITENGVVYADLKGELTLIDNKNKKHSVLQQKNLPALHISSTDGRTLVFTSGKSMTASIFQSPLDTPKDSTVKFVYSSRPIVRNGSLYYTKSDIDESGNTIVWLYKQTQNGRETIGKFNQQGYYFSYDVNNNDDVAYVTGGNLWLNDKKISSASRPVTFSNDTTVLFADEDKAHTNIYEFDTKSQAKRKVTNNGGYIPIRYQDDLYFTKEGQNGLWKLEKSGKELLVNSDLPMFFDTQHLDINKQVMTFIDETHKTAYVYDFTKNSWTKKPELDGHLATAVLGDTRYSQLMHIMKNKSYKLDLNK